MSRVSSHLRDLAGRLIALEAREHTPSGAGPPETFAVCEKLRPALSALVGGTGYGALLTRALALARTEVPWLGALKAGTDGTLEGLAALEAPLAPGKGAEGRLALLAHLLGLLSVFIGEGLTMQVMHEVWPKLSLNHSYAGIKDDHKTTA